MSIFKIHSALSDALKPARPQLWFKSQFVSISTPDWFVLETHIIIDLVEITLPEKEMGQDLQYSRQPKPYVLVVKHALIQHAQSGSVTKAPCQAPSTAEDFEQIEVLKSEEGEWLCRFNS